MSKHTELVPNEIVKILGERSKESERVVGWG